MAVEGYDYDRDAVKPPDTWGSTLKDTGLAVVGGLARTAGEIGQGVGAKEFAKGARDVERATEEQTSPIGKEVEKAAFIPTEEGETSVFKRPVRSLLRGAVNLGTSLPAYAAGAAAGTAVAGPAGGIVGGALAGGGQGFGAAEYEARRRVEDMPPEQKHQLPAWRDVFDKTGDEGQADEALVAALHPVSTDILSTLGGAAPGGGAGHLLSGALGKKAIQKIALSRIAGPAALEGAALGGGAGLSEAGRQQGEVEAGAQPGGIDWGKILKTTGEGAVPGLLFGAAAGWKGARTARDQFDKLHDTATGLKESLQGAFPGKPDVVAPPPPLVGNTPDAAQTASLKAADTTGGQSEGHENKINEIADSAIAAGEKVQQQAKQPPVTAPVTTEVTPDAAPPPTAPPPDAAQAQAPAPAPIAPVSEAPAAPAPVTPVKPVEAWASFQQRMMEAARQGATHDFLQSEFRLWKELHPDEPRTGYTRLQTMAADARSAWKVAEAKRMKDAEALGKKQAAEEDAQIAMEDAAKKAGEAPVVKAPEAKAPEVKAPEARTYEQVAAELHAREAEIRAKHGSDYVGERLEADKDPQLLKLREEARTFDNEPIVPKEPPKEVPKEPTKAGERGTDKVGKEYTLVEREVAGQKVLVRKYDTGVTAKAGEGERTKEADAAKREAKVEAKVAAKVEKVAATEPLADLQSRAEARREELIQQDRDKRAADKAAGKPARFAKIPTVDEIRTEMEAEHVEAVRKAEVAADQAERLKDASAARTKRKAGSEATEGLARDAALTEVENLAEDHKTHGDEEVQAAALISNSKRDVARTKVIERARKFVADIEKKAGDVGRKAKWSKEGAVEQNVLNALRDTKDMLRRWDKRDEGSLKARDARKAKLDQDFVDHLETMHYLREKNIEDLGARRIERSQERTAKEREKGGKKQAADTADPEELGETGLGLGDDEHEGERTGRVAEEAEGGLGEHGFTEVGPDDVVSPTKRPRTSFTIDYQPTFSDVLGNVRTRRVQLPVKLRQTAADALGRVRSVFAGLLRSGEGPEGVPSNLMAAYNKHVLEWTDRVLATVPHIKLEWLHDDDFDHVMRITGSDDVNAGGIYVRNQQEIASKVAAGRILIPDRTLNVTTPEEMAHIILHEFGHAATLQGLEHDPAYRKAMESLRDAYTQISEARGDPLVEHAISNVHEFATEANINLDMFYDMSKHDAPADVVAYVQSLPRPTRRMTMAQAFVGMLARFMGVKRPPMTMLDALVRINEHALEAQQRVHASRSTRFAAAQPGAGSSVMPIRMPTGQDVRRGLINQVASMKATGATFGDRWKAKMLNVKTTMQIAQGLDYLFGKLTTSHSPLAKAALDLMPASMRTMMENKPLSRVYADLHQRQNARVDQLLGVTGGEQLTRDAYRLQRKYGMDGTSPDGKGSMWDYFTRLVHDETNSGAFWGGEANDHLDPKNLDHAQALASIADGSKRHANLSPDLKDLRTQGHEYFERQQKAMSDWLSDNTVDELTEAIRNNEKLKQNQAPIFDKAGIDDFKKWLRDKRPDTHPHNELFRDLLNTGVEGRRLKEIRALAEIAGPYMPLMRRGDYHITGYHALPDAPNQLRRLDKGNETYDPTNPDHVARAHEFNTYEFANENDARPFIEGSDQKAQNTGEKLINKATKKIETVPRPKKNQAGQYETNYGGNLQTHATRADALKARDAFINANYDRRIHTTMQNKHVEFHNSINDLHMAREELAAVPGFKITESGQRPYEQHYGADDMARQVRKIRDDMEKSAGYAKMDRSDQKVMHDVLSQHALRVLGGTRVQSHRLPRKNVLGASHDLAHNVADYAHSTSGYLARLEYGPHIHRVADAMRAEVKTKGADKDAFLRSSVMHEYDKRRDQVAPPSADGIFGKTVNRLLQLSFLKRLASPAFHAINSTEPWMIGLPYLSGEHGFIRSAGAIGKAYNDIGGRDVAWQGLKETGRAFVVDQTMDFGKRIRDRLAGDDQRAVDAFIARGMIGRDAGMELSRLDTSGTNLVGRAIDRADHVSRQMGQAIEAINRSSLGLAAYRLAREKGFTHEEAVERAAEAIDNTMGTYDRWNAPPIFNHPLGRIALQFRKYGQRQYYLLGKMIGGALKGDNKIQSAKAFGLILATHFVMAGAIGLPTEPVMMAVNIANSMGLTSETSETLTDSFREAVAAHFGKDFGQFATTGIGNYFGVDLSGRLGINQLLGPFGAPKSQKADDIFTYYMKWLAGSAPSMTAGYLSGLGDIASGDFGSAAEKLMPIKVLSDTAKATANVMGGKVGPSGRAAGTQWTPVEGAVQAFGFRPSRIAEANAAKNVIYSQGQSEAKNRTSLTGSYVGAKTPDESAQAWAAIQRFNSQQTSPGAKIQMGDLIKQRRAAKRTEEEAARQGLPTGARVNKRHPEIAERARATYNY